jgi:hypothetical protein
VIEAEEDAGSSMRRSRVGGRHRFVGDLGQAVEKRAGQPVDRGEAPGLPCWRSGGRCSPSPPRRAGPPPRWSSGHSRPARAGRRRRRECPRGRAGGGRREPLVEAVASDIRRPESDIRVPSPAFKAGGPTSGAGDPPGGQDRPRMPGPVLTEFAFGSSDG